VTGDVSLKQRDRPTVIANRTVIVHVSHNEQRSVLLCLTLNILWYVCHRTA